MAKWIASLEPVIGRRCAPTRWIAMTALIHPVLERFPGARGLAFAGPRMDGAAARRYCPAFP
jgi:hypothetical protein